MEILPGFHVRCDSCGAEGWTENGSALDIAVKCPCCTIDHDHSDCDRTITITARAILTGSINQP